MFFLKNSLYILALSISLSVLQINIQLEMFLFPRDFLFAPLVIREIYFFNFEIMFFSLLLVYLYFLFTPNILWSEIVLYSIIVVFGNLLRLVVCPSIEFWWTYCWLIPENNMWFPHIGLSSLNISINYVIVVGSVQILCIRWFLSLGFNQLFLSQRKSYSMIVFFF